MGRAAHPCSVLGFLWPFSRVLLSPQPPEQRPVCAAVSCSSGYLKVTFLLVLSEEKPDPFVYSSLIKSKVMPALVESEEDEEEEREDAEIKDPLPEKLQNSMVNLDEDI